MVSSVPRLVFVFQSSEVLRDNCHVTYEGTADKQCSLALSVILRSFLNYHWLHLKN